MEILLRMVIMPDFLRRPTARKNRRPSVKNGQNSATAREIMRVGENGMEITRVVGVIVEGPVLRILLGLRREGDRLIPPDVDTTGTLALIPGKKMTVGIVDLNTPMGDMWGVVKTMVVPDTAPGILDMVLVVDLVVVVVVHVNLVVVHVERTLLVAVVGFFITKTIDKEALLLEKRKGSTRRTDLDVETSKNDPEQLLHLPGGEI